MKKILVIGIDLGGTKIKGVLLDEKGRVVKAYEHPTQARLRRQKIIKNILEVINVLRAGKSEEVKGIGLATPGFALSSGRMTCMPNIKKLEGFNLKKELQKRTKLKVWLENDANCFALAEHMQGAAIECKDSIGVIIGTGIGTGIVIDNMIYRGAIGGAGEAGHTKLVLDIHEAGHIKGIKEVEDLISGPSIIRRYEELSGKKTYSPVIILNKKDEFSRKVYAETVYFTGIFLANLINIFNPEAIIIGGGVSNLPYYKDVQKVVNKYAHPSLAKACKIRKSKLGELSGAIGAAELALSMIS
ncbi:ROK family protein [Candidatus Woesearchaeota archaeon]|nr:ROK family protein [Candidatus Woesearchaeota archaeon]